MGLNFSIYPLGDSALTIEFANTIDEQVNHQVINLFHSLQEQPIEGTIELIPAYSSLTICYEINTRNSFQRMCELVEGIIAGKTAVAYSAPSPKIWDVGDKLSATAERRKELTVLPPPRQIKIPVCYSPELAPDLEVIAETKKLSMQDLIAIHTKKKYHVYMLGFLPGFPYMGTIDKKLEIQRKPEPEMVKAGAVGIAGLQTGIYPLDSPGGWQIIGRTPVKLFDPSAEIPCLLFPGDEVEFYSISHEAFENYQAGNS